MPEYLAPGVYVEEVEMGPKPIEGVSTSTGGFLGQTERGPTEPRLLTSFADFERTYGGFDLYREGGALAGTYLAYAVDGYFRNGGKRCYLARVTPSTRTAAATFKAGATASGTLGVHPSSVDFGDVVENRSLPATVTLTNRGDPYAGDPDVTVTGVSVGGTNADQFDHDFSGPVTLGAGASTDVEVTFRPTTTGSLEAELTVSHGTTGEETVSLEGSGVDPADGELAVSPATLAFGEGVDGYSETATVTVTNLGDPEADPAHGDVTVTEDQVAVTGTDADRFLVDFSGSVTLSPGESTELVVMYTPETGGANATLEISAVSPAVTVALQGSGTAGSDVFDVEAVGPGEWGGRVAVTVADAGSGRGDQFKATVRYWTAMRSVPSGTPDAMTVRMQDPPDVEEVYDNLSADESSTNHYEKRFDSASNLVEVTPTSGVVRRPANGTRLLAVPNGSLPPDPTEATVEHYEGDETVPPDERTGLAAFAEVDDISIVCAPDEKSVAGLTDALVTHCETLKDRFAVLQSKENDARPSKLTAPVDSKYAAFYYPWVTILDPATNVEKLVPPGGHVAGIYARSDAERGVHKAPANEVVRGVTELQFPVSKGAQEVLNPRSVNCIRSFPGRGIRVWGARTTSSDPLWKYVNVRRLFLYIEESIDEGTQWVVFEPNDETLWARVRQTVSNFLTTVWRDGALMGTTAEEAFFVKCDRSTMTQDDIDNGKLIVVVGVAPVKPAEFVVFRIAQWTGGAEGA